MYIYICIYIYIYPYIHNLYNIYAYISTPRKVLKPCRSKMGITHMESLPGYPQNDFVATQALGHMMYVMYSELLNCI